MTDPKPYTSEELAQLPGAGELVTDASWDTLDLARVRATVQALATARARVKELEAEIQERKDWARERGERD